MSLPQLSGGTNAHQGLVFNRKDDEEFLAKKTRDQKGKYLKEASITSTELSKNQEIRVPMLS